MKENMFKILITEELVKTVLTLTHQLFLSYIMYIMDCKKIFWSIVNKTMVGKY